MFGENISLQDINVSLCAFEMQVFSTAAANFLSIFAAGTVFGSNATKAPGT